ncbi:MAG TPA: dienelactone hydrolase family protein [Ktedonobacteraceae bacterium]
MAQTAQSVTFPSGTRSLDGYLARPDGDGPFPAIVVIHEIFGLNENIKDITRRFVSEGYVALGVDLFAGRNRAVCMFSFMAGGLLNSLNHRGIVDLKAALTFLSEQPGVDNTRLGAIGFCMGGGFAIAWACTDNRLKAIAPFYATNPRPLEAVSRLCPVVGSYPTGDITTSQGHKLEAALESYSIPHDIKFYPGARHSFFNDQRCSYNPAAAEDSWQRVLTFFKEQIGARSEV